MSIYRSSSSRRRRSRTADELRDGGSSGSMVGVLSGIDFLTAFLKKSCEEIYPAEYTYHGTARAPITQFVSRAAAAAPAGTAPVDAH